MFDKRASFGADPLSSLATAATSAAGLPPPPPELLSAVSQVLGGSPDIAKAVQAGATAVQNGATPAQLANAAATLPAAAQAAMHAGAGVVQAAATNPPPPGLTPLQNAGHAFAHAAAHAPAAAAKIIQHAVNASPAAVSGALLANTKVGWMKTHPVETASVGLGALVLGWFGWQKRHAIVRTVKHPFKKR